MGHLLLRTPPNVLVIGPQHNHIIWHLHALVVVALNFLVCDP